MLDLPKKKLLSEKAGVIEDNYGLWTRIITSSSILHFNFTTLLCS